VLLNRSALEVRCPPSLDIEGAELPVLKTLPWLEVDIEIISVETNHVGSVFPGSQVLPASAALKYNSIICQRDIGRLLESQGYVLATTVGQ
jgi:hypothetical protein